MRKVVAAVLFAVAGAGLLVSASAIATLFDDYKDSSDSLYIGWAAVTLAVAVVAVAVGALLLRER
jgi:hypothetical protein